VKFLRATRQNGSAGGRGTRALPGGFDVVFDGIGEDDYPARSRRSSVAACSAPSVTRRVYNAASPARDLDVERARVSMAAAAELVARRKVPLRLLDQRDARATSRLDLERALRPVAARAIRPRCRAHLFRRGRRRTPPYGGRGSRWQAGAMPGPPVADATEQPRVEVRKFPGCAVRTSSGREAWVAAVGE
jgi:hypothetical protein